MSEFKKYADRLNKMAKLAFADYEAAEMNFKEAKKKLSQTPEKRGFVDAEYSEKYFRAKAECAKAENEFYEAKRQLRETSEKIKEIRAELLEEVNKHYAADPEKINPGTLTLLQNNVLTAYDFSNLMDKAVEEENYTMMRLIAKYADEASKEAAKTYGENSVQTKSLRIVAIKGKSDPGTVHLDAFDALCYIYDRTVNAPAMINMWDNLTGNTIENF